MNQNDQMREALLNVIERAGENFKRQFGFSAEANWIIRDLKESLRDGQALNHTPDTGKMVRLTDKQIMGIDARTPGGLIQFANAIMDAMIKKNGGQQ